MTDAADGVVTRDVRRTDNLARQIDVADRSSVLAHQLTMTVDTRSASRHHQIRNGVHRIVRTFLKGEQVVRTTEHAVLTLGNVLIILSEGRFQIRGANLFSQLSDGVRLEHIALFDQLSDLLFRRERRRVAHHAGEQRLVFRHHVLRKDNIDDVLVAGAPNGALIHAGRLRLVEDAVTVGVDPDRTIVVDVAAQGGLEAGDRNRAAVAGAVIHVVKRRASLTRKIVTAADRRVGVVGGDVGEVEFLQPTLAVAIAAGRNDGGRRTDFLIADHNAGHVAVIVQHDIGHQRIQAELNRACINVALELVAQTLDEVRTAAGGRTARRIRYAVDVHGQVAAAVHLIGELNADIFLQPVNRRTGALGMHLRDLGVHELFAAQVDEILIEQLRAVFDTRGLLNLIACAADGAARRVRGAAYAVVLFENKHICAQLSRTHAGRQTRHARANDDDIRLNGDFQLARFFGALAGQRRGNRLFDGFRGHGRAGNRFNVGALRFDDCLRNLLDRRIADTGGFLMLKHLDAGNLAVLNRYGNLHRAAHAVRRAFIHAVCRNCFRHRVQRRRHSKCHGQQYADSLFVHVRSS